MESLIQRYEGEIQRIQEFNQVEILRHKGEIAKLKTQAQNVKTGNREEKELRREN